MSNLSYAALRAWHAYFHVGYAQFFIRGPQGSGKTTYAMISMYQLYRRLGFDKEEAWRIVVEMTVFKPAPALDLMEFMLELQELHASKGEKAAFEEAVRHEQGWWITKLARLATRRKPELKYRVWRVPVILFDDAGLYFSKYLTSLGSEGYWTAMRVNALINLIRTMASCTIFTSPDLDVLKELRKKSWIVSEPFIPHGENKPHRIMRHYKKRLLPSGQIVTKRVKREDVYRVDVLPDWVYDEYERKRREALRWLLSLMRKYPTPTEQQITLAGE